jgi:hypothetical protein
MPALPVKQPIPAGSVGMRPLTWPRASTSRERAARIGPAGSALLPGPEEGLRRVGG